MYELHDQKSRILLSEDLRWLEFSKGGVRLAAAEPFQLDWTGIPVSLAGAGERKVTADEKAIRIDFADFNFPARFPGNDYCRPDKKYVPDFRFSLELRLADEDFVVEVSPVENLGDCSLSMMILPQFFTASSQECAQLVLPVDYGTRIDFPRSGSYSRIFQPSASWTLPVHGLFRSCGGVGLWCDHPDREIAVSFNQGASMQVQAVCRLLFGPSANSSRSLRFMLFEPGSDFRHLARRCRELRRASGRFRTLQEKAAEHPEVGQLPGAVFWKHNVYYGRRPEGKDHAYSLYVARPDWNENEGLPGNWTAEEIFQTAHDRGFDRVAVCNTGWNRDGFDAGYPARLPMNPGRGTEEELKKAVKFAHGLSEGYSLSVHDNYIDVYDAGEFHPEEVLQPTPGRLMRTSVWRGGQAHWLCSKHSLRYAGRDMAKVAELTGRGCVYLDVMAATALYPCFAEGHEQTRKEDWENKRRVFSLAKECFGALAVEGCGTDHYADLVDVGAYGGLHFTGMDSRTDPLPVPVPLWQMVYHDSVLNYFGEGYSPVHGSEYRLYQALYTLLPTSFNEEQKRLSLELRDAFDAPLTDFAELVPRTVTRTEDGAFRTHGVACSSYGREIMVIVNFNDSEWRTGSIRIPPRDYVVVRQRPEGEQQQ